MLFTISGNMITLFLYEMRMIRIRALVWPKSGSHALYTKNGTVEKIILNCILTTVYVSN